MIKKLCQDVSHAFHLSLLPFPEWVPPEPEEFYHLTGYERTPMCVGDDRGNAVYSIDSGTVYSLIKSYYSLVLLQPY